MRRLLDKVNNPAVVLIVLVLVTSANGFVYFYYTRDSDQGPIVEEERGFPRAEGASPGTPKKDAAPKVGRSGAVGGEQDEASPVQAVSPHSPLPTPASRGASHEGGLPVGTSVSPTVPAAQGIAPPATATPTATASPTAAATAQYAQYATATPTALVPTGGPPLAALPFALVAGLAMVGFGLAALVFLRRAPC